MAKTSTAHRPLFRPFLEAMEDRFAPAVLSVTSLADNLVNDGLVTLREAITAANTNTTVDGVTGDGADSIEFLVTGLISLTASLPPVTEALSMNGPGANQLAISGNDLFRILSMSASTTLANLTLTHGKATGAGTNGDGGAVAGTGDLTITNVVFAANSASNRGGAVSSSFGRLLLSDSTFTGNTAFQGGALHSANLFPEGTLQNCTFADNTADFGGAILNFGALTISDSVFTSNAAENDGGAIDNFTGNDGSARVSVFNSVFAENTARDGGAIANVASVMGIHGSTFTGNSASRDGGAIHSFAPAAKSGDFRIDDSVFTVNSAARDGGALSNGAAGNGLAFLLMARCNLSGNTSARDGGGVFNFNTVSATIEASTLSANTAQDDGGGVYATGTLTITATIIADNTAAKGGGIGNGAGGTLTVIGCTLSGNTALDGGGGIDNAGTQTIANSTLSGNSSNAFGGGIRHLSGNTLLTSATITGNRADADNNATGSGGGLSSVAAGVALRNTIVAGNRKGVAGPPDDVHGDVDTASAFSNLIGAGGAGGLVHGINENLVGISDPRLGPLQNNGGPTPTHALLPGSPALDRGNSLAAALAGLTTDQRGGDFVRAADTADADLFRTVDIGAYEALVSLEDISDQSTNEDVPLSLSVPIADAPQAALAVSVASSNQVLVPPANIQISGTGSARTVKITPAADRHGTTTITVTVSAGGQSMQDTFVLTVNPVNDAPASIVPIVQKVKANKTLIFAGAKRITIADVDAGAGNIRVTLSVTKGTLNLAGAGLVSVVGNGKSKVVLTGTVEKINAALNGMRLKPKAGYRGKIKLTILTEDLGNSGLGGGRSDMRILRITVA